MILVTASAKVSYEIPKGPTTALRSVDLQAGQVDKMTYFEYLAVQAELAALSAQGFVSYAVPADQLALMSCDFILDSANGNGLGIRSLKAQGPISGVFGYTSATPAAGNNLAAGFFKIMFSQAFSAYYGGFSGFVSPLSGSNVDAGSFVTGTTYVIVSVGSTNWTAVGLNSDITPAVGVAFTATAAGSGSGVVQAPSKSGIFAIEVVGDAALTLVGANPYMIVQTLNASGTPTSPANGSVLGMSFYID